MVDVTYLIYVIYTNFRTFLCKKYDVRPASSLTTMFTEEDRVTG